MAEFESVYEDERAWVYFVGDDHDVIGVYRRCVECGRYLKKGELAMNLAGDIKLTGWICKKHGEVQPYDDRDC